jgi:hypothetical protein
MEMEQRVRRLERSNKVLTAALVVFCVVLCLLWVGLKPSDILVGKQVTTGALVVMDQLGPQQKPRVQLFPTPASTFLSFIGSDNKALLGIGIEKDPKRGEIPMIISQTKAGVQALAPNEEGKLVLGKMHVAHVQNQDKKAVPNTK